MSGWCLFMAVCCEGSEGPRNSGYVYTVTSTTSSTGVGVAVKELCRTVLRDLFFGK